MSQLSIRIEIKTLNSRHFESVLEWLRKNAGNNKFDWIVTNGVMAVFVEDEIVATAFKLRWSV